MEKLENREQDLLDEQQAVEQRKQHGTVVRASNRQLDLGFHSEVIPIPRNSYPATLDTNLSLNVATRTMARWKRARMSMLRVGARMSADEIEARNRNRARGLRRSRTTSARPVRPPPLSSVMLTARREPSIIRDVAYANSQTSVPAPAISSTVVNEALQASPEFSTVTNTRSTLPLLPTVLFPSAEEVVRRQATVANATRKVVPRVQAVSEDNTASITSDTVFSHPQQSVTLQTSSATASAPSTSQLVSSSSNSRPIMGGKRTIT